jgi:hypothetical protein
MRLTEAQIGEIAMLAIENGNEWRVEDGNIHPYTEFYAIAMYVPNSGRLTQYVRLLVGKCIEDSPEGHVLHRQAHALVRRLNAGDVSALRETEFIPTTWETEI